MYLKNDDDENDSLFFSLSLSPSFLFLPQESEINNNDALSMIYNKRTTQTRCITTTAHANDINYSRLYARFTRKHPAFP